MSNSCCCCCCKPEKPDDNDGPCVPPCTKYKVTIVSMVVTDVGHGLLEGKHLESIWTFVVNGVAQTWVNKNLGVGTHNPGNTFYVDVPACDSTITLVVSGIDEDPWPWPDDPLPGFTAVYGQAENWGVGSQSGGGSDANITYTLNYNIICAEPATISLDRDLLMAYARDKAETRKAEVPGPSILISWALNRFRRAGWEVAHVTEEHFVLEGHGHFPRDLEEKYGRREEEGKRRKK